jgi:hypothetical protein
VDRVVGEGVDPAVLIVDRDPEVAMYRVVATRGTTVKLGMIHGVMLQ